MSMGNLAEKKERPPVFDFLMSVDCALGHGPITSINALWFREKLGFVGPVTQNGASYIEKHDLFGGDDGGEGGVSGSVEFYLGGWDQIMSPALAFRYGLTPDTAPGYRGVSHIFFHGGRPPGTTDVIGLESSLSSSGTSWQPELNDVDVYYREFDIRDGSSFPNYEQLQAEIDSGLVSLGMNLIRGTANNGTWYVGNRATFLDADMNVISNVSSNATLGGGFDEGEDRGYYAFDSFPIPPLTRVIWYGHKNTIPSTGHLTEVELTKNAGILTNFFGDSFDQEDLDNIVARGFRWSTHTPWYQGPHVSVTAAPADLPNMSGVEALIHPIVGVNSSGDYQYALEGDAFERDDRLANDSVFQSNARSVIDEILGPDYQRNERYVNENVLLERLPDANPALIIYECMVDTDWGRGENPANLDVQSYRDAALTLQSERFGLSIRWNGQDEIENFISLILDHIKALHFRHPVTGLWTLKLLRDDYDTNESLVLDDSNCRVEASSVRGYGEVPNVVKVQYTEAKNEKLESVEAHNLANIAIQGGVVSTTHKYIGIRNRWLAQKVADRDVMELSAPLASAEVYVPRAFSENIAPGDVVNLTNSRYNLAGFFRVVDMDMGTSGKREVKLDVLTDVFSVVSFEQSVNPTGRPTDLPGEQPPTDLNDDGATNSLEFNDVNADSSLMLMSVPYIAAGSSVEDGNEYLMITAADSTRELDYVDVWGLTSTGTGSSEIARIHRTYETSAGSLTEALVAEEESVLPSTLLNAVLGLDIGTGDRLIIGATDVEHEIVIIDRYSSSLGGYVVIRGAHDTIPRAWPIGTPVFDGAVLQPPFISQLYAPGDVPEFYLAPRVNGVTLDFLSSTEIEHTVVERIAAPIRPANVTIDGGDVFVDTIYEVGTVPNPIPLAWANRNRTMESGTVPRWTDGNVTPETGQTTTIRVWYGAQFDQLELEVTGLTGTTYDLDSSLLVSAPEYEVEFVAVRDGIESLQNYRASLAVTQSGFGYNFGFNFGQT